MSLEQRLRDEATFWDGEQGGNPELLHEAADAIRALCERMAAVEECCRHDWLEPEVLMMARAALDAEVTE